jgi:hypothetical protein
MREPEYSLTLLSTLQAIAVLPFCRSDRKSDRRIYYVAVVSDLSDFDLQIIQLWIGCA